MMRHQSVRDESNTSWSICMYTYLRNIGPLFFIGFSSTQKFESLIVSFNALFALSYSSHILWSWPLWGYIISEPLSLGYQLCLVFFHRIIKPTLLCVCHISPQFDHVSKCSIWVFLGDKALWKKIWLFFIKNFWNFKAWKIILMFVQNKLVSKNTSDSHR
jgi:hypothetical protein